MTNKKVHWHRDTAPDGTPRYWADMAIGTDYSSAPPRDGVLVHVADAAMTGRAGVDDYPWDWSLTAAGLDHAYRILPFSTTPVRLRTVGAADTLRSVKDNVAALLGSST